MHSWSDWSTADRLQLVFGLVCLAFGVLWSATSDWWDGLPIFLIGAVQFPLIRQRQVARRKAQPTGSGAGVADD